MIADQLLEASLDGVPFLVPREQESGGRKLSVHEYPGSDDRFAEDLGRRLPVFKIVAVIHGFDVLNLRQRLSATLSSAGPKVLVHPYLGRRLVAVSDYSLATSDRALGEVVYDIELVQTEAVRSLEGDAGGINAVFSAASDARTALDSAVESRYSPLSIVDSLQKVGARAREGIAEVQGQVSAVVNPIQDSLNEAATQITLANDAIISIVRTPQRLVTSMRAVFDAARTVVSSPSEMRREWAALTGFGADRTPIQRTTAKRETEDDNQTVIEQFFRIEALINSLEAEADATFGTDDELTATRLRLADDFTRILLTQDDVIASSTLGDEVLTDANVTEPSAAVSEAIAFNASLAFDPTLRAALDDLRVATTSVLDDAEVTVARVTDFELGVTDPQLATYLLYGGLENLATIAALNGDQSHGFMRRTIKGIVA